MAISHDCGTSAAISILERQLGDDGEDSSLRRNRAAGAKAPARLGGMSHLRPHTTERYASPHISVFKRNIIFRGSIIFNLLRF